MKKVLIVLAVASFAGVAHAETSVSDKQFVTASRCSALAASENLGKLDTTALEAFLRDQGANRASSVRVSAASEMIAARRKADSADGAKKAKLLAERQSVCAGFLTPTQAAAQ
jgi:hypothetical protein